MIQHTPGPWSTDDMMGGIWGPDGKPIQTCGQHAIDFGKGSEEARDNAFLIAAAPDLLEACKESLNALLDYVETLEKLGADLNYGHKVIEQLNFAIAKSRG